jgi:XTP/dITP diphosphohydrolase
MGLKQILVASNNPGKLRELRQLFVPLGIELVSQSVFDIPEASEPYTTFVENALAKAHHAAAYRDMPILAEDSGICVDALNGAPGVYSARYAGEPKSDERNNNKLLEALQAQRNRKAHYFCLMVLLRHVADPQPIIAEGEWHGEILCTPRGRGGFGYDPLFLVSGTNKTGAELSMDEKNKISHRGKALTMLIQKLKESANLVS